MGVMPNYPCTIVLGPEGGEFWASDGFRLSIPANAFPMPVTLTIAAPVSKGLVFGPPGWIGFGATHRIEVNSGGAPQPVLPVVITLPHRRLPEWLEDCPVGVFALENPVADDGDEDWVPGTEVPQPGAGQGHSGGFRTFGRYRLFVKVR